VVTEELRRQFGAELSTAHRRYQAELDRQYGFYKMTCTREQGERDGELARVDPADRAAIALVHERYDNATRKAAHIYEAYEKRAWKRYETDTATLRAKYGITEVEG